LITLGVDLASQAKNTAIAEIDWSTRRAIATKPADDDEILAAMARADHTGIDAPFGWPEAFVAAMATGEWDDDVPTKKLTHRVTDEFVHRQTGLWPLSVSSDRIALPAFRCARLLARHGRDDHVYEVYPGAALTIWGLERRGYKNDVAIRRRIAAALPVQVGDDTIDDDDELDAVICAIVARLAAIGKTHPPPDGVEREGWIHIPLGVLDPGGN
jgi:predicted nuclease with RNAse H fold